jgi:hypothetical protein
MNSLYKVLAVSGRDVTADYFEYFGFDFDLDYFLLVLSYYLVFKVFFSSLGSLEAARLPL